MAGEVALEEAGGVAAGFAFGDAAGDVVLGGGVVLAAVEDDGVEGAVELAVAAAAEPVPGRLAAGGGDRVRRRRGGRRLASERSRPWCDQATISWAATIGPTPGSSSSVGCERADVGEQSRARARRLRRSRLGSGGRGCAARAGSRARRLPAARVRRRRLAAVEQLPYRQPAQLLAERVGGGHDHRAQLGQCFAADVDGAAARDQQQPQRLPPLTCARERERVARERRPCRPGRVEACRPCRAAAARPRGVRLTSSTALAAFGEEAGQPGAVAAGALDRPDAATGRVLLGDSEAARGSRARSRPPPPRRQQRPPAPSRPP